MAPRPPPSPPPKNTVKDVIQAAGEIALIVSNVAQSVPYVGAVATVLREIARIMGVCFQTLS